MNSPELCQDYQQWQKKWKRVLYKAKKYFLQINVVFTYKRMGIKVIYMPNQYLSVLKTVHGRAGLCL